MIDNGIEFRPIVINKATIDSLLKTDRPHELMGLYVFYYYTAVWQKTNQPKATTGYTAEGLHIPKNRVRRLKKQLIELGLVEDIMTKDKNNKVTGHFVKINYYSKKNHPNENRQGGKTHRVESLGTNAYSNNKEMLNNNNKMLGDSSNPREHLINPKDSFELKLAKKLKKAIDKKGNINRTIQLKTWSNQIRKLISKSTKSYVKKVILWYCQNIEEKYTPQIYKANDLTDRFKRIEDAMHRAECNHITDSKQTKKSNIKITKTARQIAERLANFGNWPAGCVELLPEVVQTSCNNYREYIEKHFELAATLKNKKKTDSIDDVYSFAHLVISNNENLIDVEWYIERIWLKKIWDNIKGWEGFNGDFRNYAFNIKHKRFDAMGQQLALGFCADTKRWGQYKKMLQTRV